MSVVLCNGCFDILHAGHVEHLRRAKAMGGKLIVSLTLDGFVNKGPGRPINTWEKRAMVLRELRSVDEVIPAESATHAIKMVKPDIFVKGIDYADLNSFTEDVVQACASVGAVLAFTTTPKQSATETIRKAMA
jgi:rfaE bifunctional protein nucleotidyltransferase chain/domain